MKSVDTLLNIILGSSVGVFIGRSIAKYLDYINHMELYATYSAPWYLGIWLEGGVTLVVVVVVFIIKLVLKKMRTATKTHD